MRLLSFFFLSLLVFAAPHAARAATAALPPKRIVPLPKPRPAIIPAEKPQTPDAAKKGEPPKSARMAGSEETLPAVDTDESIPLPPYPKGARESIGKPQTYTLGEEDTLLDVARYFELGYVELRAANPDIDPWTPVPGEAITIPSFHLLPRAPQEGIVVNLAQMRLYYFQPKKAPVTFPIGIGRDGLLTPTGETKIVRKVANPIWYPTPRMREENPALPAAVPAGPNNPLGAFALYLGWPEFRIHGTDKPWAIGRRVSSGCMRMYPEDIAKLYKMVSVGTKVTVVDQPVLVGWVGGALYLEADPSKTQSNDIETSGGHVVKPLDDKLKKVITDAAGDKAKLIDWDAVKDAVEERTGYPVRISAAPEAQKPAPEKDGDIIEYKYDYNN